MAQAGVIDARLVRVWHGAAPGGASILVCALTTKGFQQTKNTNTAVIPDCDDPTVVAPVKRTPISKDATISGDGYYEPVHRAAIQAMFDSSVSTLVYFEISNGEAAVGQAGYYSGKFFLTTFNITADEGNYVRSAMTWEVDGAWAWTAAPFAVVAMVEGDAQAMAEAA
jgi:hypothetical protein